MILCRRSVTATCFLRVAIPSYVGRTLNRPQRVNNMSRRRLHISERRASQVGFVGLGNMGSCMATNLVKAGYDVLLYDADKTKTAELASSTGATAATSLQHVAQSCTSIITMLPNTPHVEAVYLRDPNGSLQDMTCGSGRGKGGGGLVDWVEKGTLLVDSSTIDPLISRKVNAAMLKKGAIMLDAPVSGGVPAAASGSLTFIVGGNEEGVERARPLLEVMGKNVLHCGEAGAGCVAKVCNNLALAISMVGVSEAMSLGSKMGMDPKVLANVLNTSTARCWSSAAYNPCPGVMEDVPASRGFKGGFSAKLMEKDLHLALQAARASSQSVPMGALAHQLYSLMCGQSQRNATKDFSGIYELISGNSDFMR